MGLLSDPEYGSVKWVRILKKIHSPLCFICYIAAIAWFFMLANKDFNNETYFSENALLPGLVTNEFNGEHPANRFYKEFKDELEDPFDETDQITVPWLVAKMSQLHLEVYTQNFTLNYPLGQGQVFKGTNVYGILRAPRTSSLEALVVSVPFRGFSSHQKGTAAGIALMLAFAQFARPQKYWAKDIIFLVTEHEQLGMQAWLEAYHGLQRDSASFYTSLGSFWQPGTSGFNLGKYIKGFEWITDYGKCLDPGTFKGRSGSIQAAINLEFHTPRFKYIEVKVEGLNGQLPNLDLVNLVRKLCIKSGIHYSYKNSYSWIRTRDKTEEWVNSIWTMLGMVSAQIAGVPNGNHGLFHRFGIEAVTLEGRDIIDPAGVPPRVQTLSYSNFQRLGVTLESILRSLNNLLERFHQSYFFYMLGATNRFISIGQYMPSLCLLCGAMLIRALSLWVTLQKDYDDQSDKVTDKNTEKDSPDDVENDDKDSPDDVENDDKDSPDDVENDDKDDDENDDKDDDENDYKDLPGTLQKDYDDQSDKVTDKNTEKDSPDDVENDDKDDDENDDKDDDENEYKDLPETLQKDYDDQSDKVTHKNTEKNSPDDVENDDKDDDENEYKDLPDDVENDDKDDDENDDKDYDKNDYKDVLEDEENDELIKDKIKETDIGFSVVNIGGNYLLMHLFGYAVMNSPILFSQIGATYFREPSEVSVFYGLIAVSVLLILITPRFLKLRTGLTFEEMSIVNILLLIELSTACLAIGMHNYPLGLCIAAVYTPLALIVGVVDEKQSRLCLYLKRIFCLALHPLFVISFILILYSMVLFPEESLLSKIGRGRDAAMQAIMFSIVDSMIYGNWLFNVGSTVILPTWLLFWQILCNRVTT